MCDVAGPNYPVVNPVAPRGTQQRQSSQHSCCGTLVQSGEKKLSWIWGLIDGLMFQVAYKKYLLEKYDRDTKSA